MRLDFCGHRCVHAARGGVRAPGVELVAGRACGGRHSSEKTNWVGWPHLGQAGQPESVWLGQEGGGGCRIGPVFRSVAGRAGGWLWRRDGKSRNSGRSAIRWAGHGAGSGERTPRPDRVSSRLRLPSERSFQRKVTASWFDADHACIGDGGARDVSAQVLEGAGSGTGRLDMHSPILAPDLRIDLPIVLLEQAVEVLAEGGLQVRQDTGGTAAS